MRVIAALLLTLALAAPTAVRAQEAQAVATAEPTASHALALFGEPKYPAGFSHFDYADPVAPKGGALVLGTAGTFDTLNLIPLGGQPPRSLGLLYDSLMVESQDESGVYYGLLAESVTIPDDASWAVFALRPEARWHDGVPVTAEDVVWSWETVRDKAEPFLKSFFRDVTGAEALDDHRVRFTFASRNIRKPIGQVAASLPILPKHWWTSSGRDIGQGTVEPPLGSGPYRIASVDPGRTLAWERVPDYWGRDLPVNRGLWNFDRIRYDYYRDRDVEFTAFKSGTSDFRQEFTSLFWATGYDIPAARGGRLIRAEIASEDPRGMQGYLFNLRRVPFSDPKVREALGWLYDFEWVNKTLFSGLYDRLTSYFNAEGFRSSGVPEGEEKALLEPFRGQVPDALFDTPFTLPTTDGSGNMRDNIRTALRLLKEAGWEQRDGVMTNIATGAPMRFEILIDQAVYERATQPFIDRLRQIGIQASLRRIDTAQMQKRRQSFDYDVMPLALAFYPPPGSELRNYFGSAVAGVEGSANYMGIRNPVADALIDKVVAARDLSSLQVATRALDRVLLWNRYVILQWGKTDAWVAYWNRFGQPKTQPTHRFGDPNGIAFPSTWWIDPAKDAALTRGGG
ncbi:extracellular solute-binding protein [Inquilinus limosus]|uniref:ABC transporter substrate-binding protein n=1 Tax=Inquilinus limosus TaxID=171674 RepID=A0A211ZGJ4_9PROT|nr:extracellular solute-binding protein [Inquilinus limosus]OWJ64316.1 ABC transporter substrate-binding protein [Inquilinus limosus]